MTLGPNVVAADLKPCRNRFAGTGRKRSRQTVVSMTLRQVSGLPTRSRRTPWRSPVADGRAGQRANERPSATRPIFGVVLALCGAGGNLSHLTACANDAGRHVHCSVPSPARTTCHPRRALHARSVVTNETIPRPNRQRTLHILRAIRLFLDRGDMVSFRGRRSRRQWWRQVAPPRG